MDEDKTIYEREDAPSELDPDAIPIKDRRVFAQPYDLVVESLIDQIKGGTIFLRPLSERPSFQRNMSTTLRHSQAAFSEPRLWWGDS